jgi:hypothetical protein
MDAMNAPGATQIGQLLSEIRDRYGTLRDMTRRFLDEFSFPALPDLLKERAGVLLKIDSDEERLLRISDVECLKHYGEYGEITDHIAAILSCDREITERVKHGMKVVNRELSSLSATSNAAIMYAHHTRG